jgi:hypothetical protein
MAFSFLVELLNMRVRGGSRKKVEALEEEGLEQSDNQEEVAQ